MSDNRKQTEDDGRTIAPMNLEGMPWYRKDAPKTKRNPNADEFSKQNMWRYVLSSIGAGLLIVFVFGFIAAAFVWFCCNVWFA